MSNVAVINILFIIVFSNNIHAEVKKGGQLTQA